MIILIAEAKTMVTAQQPVTPQEFAANMPVCETKADEIMIQYATLTVADIAQLTGMTASLSTKLYKYAYDFPNKSTGLQAIQAFTGVLFKALDHASLPEEAKRRCANNVRIISSLYCWLKPHDIIKPYRLNYTSKVLSPENKELSAAAFWKSDGTIQLVNTIKNDNHREILNLLPGDAARFIDWKLVKKFAKVWKVDFTDAATNATPSAGRLKEMRGKLLRQILTEGISDCNSIRNVVSDSYICDGTPQYPDHLHFLC